ncbi:MAG: chemotaxis protein CheW [Opitutaceae bacterium]|nr:chemotaxis protein CheW [Opitutaceae bacterium]
MAEAAASVRQYCTFEVDSLFLGIDVLHVQEVMKSRDLAPVPLAHDAVQGLLNLRGQIVTAIDLRRRLDLPPRPENRPPMLVVARTEGAVVAFLVDAIGDVIDVAEDTFEPPPDTIRTTVRDLIVGVHKLPKRLLHVLDAEHAADLAR